MAAGVLLSPVDGSAVATVAVSPLDFKAVRDDGQQAVEAITPKHFMPFFTFRGGDSC